MRRSLLFLLLAACSSTEAAQGPPQPDAAADSAAPAIDAAPPPRTCLDGLPPSSTVDPANEVFVTNDPPAPFGIFDPSIVYPAGAPAGAMAYSAVKAKDDIATRIALSDDEGATWTFVVQANAATPVPNDAGNLISEVSSLVVDPSDPDASRRWKLFSHRYLAKGQTLFYDVGHVALQTAPAAEGPWSAPAANVGWRGTNPFSSEGAKLVAQDVPALADCVAFTEPSALALPNGVLALSLGCVSTMPATSIRVVLLFSADHASTWTYAGVLVPASDAPCLGRAMGLARVNAVDLFGAAGKVWLSVTPENPTLGYRGCAFVEIVDLASAKIARDDAGAPKVTTLLATPTDQFSGACAHAEGATKATALMSVAFLDQPRIFRIVRSGVRFQ